MVLSNHPKPANENSGRDIDAKVLSEEKKQQVSALGRLGWSLRQIQKATRIRRETASRCLKAAGIAVPPPKASGRRAAQPAIA